MNKEEVGKLVDVFLAEQREKPFSTVFRSNLIDRVLKINSVMPSQYIRDVYDLKINELRRYALRMLLAKFGIYKKSPDKAEEIVNTGFAKFWKSFDGSEMEETEDKNKAKNPEFSYLLECVWSAQSDAYRKENPEVIIDLIDEERKPIKDEEGRQIKLKIPSIFYEYLENAYDSLDENDEENTYSDGFLPESEDAIPNRSESDSEEKGFDEDIDSFPSDSSIPAIASPQPDENSHKTNEDLIKFGDKYFAPVAADQIAKFYLLSGKVDLSKGRRTFLDMEQSHKPIRKFVIDPAKPELKNVTVPTTYHINRLRFLKCADDRKWMERAISELRKSREKMLSDIKQMLKIRRNFDEVEFKSKIPLLSAVAVDRDGNLIDTCFKGKINQNKNGRDITWDKHCEYSLFTEVIKEDNIKFLKDGTLYVTLEPCNSRKSYLDGNERKPKIPCAVRCVEAGIKRIFIGSYDYNPKVKTKGEEILRTGIYTFQLDNGKVSEEALALKKHFDDKKYDSIETKNEIKYKIGNPVEVVPFDFDLREEILELNAWFLKHHEEDIYRKYE